MFFTVSEIQVVIVPYFLERRLLFFFVPIGCDYSREAIISNIAYWKSFPKYFFIVLFNEKKIISSNKLNLRRKKKREDGEGLGGGRGGDYFK